MVDNADLIPTLDQQKEENTLDYTEIPLFDRRNPRLVNIEEIEK